MNTLIYDGMVDAVDTLLYFFVSEDLESAAKIFMDLYEEDIMEYAAAHIDMDIEEYQVEGCSLCIEIDKETNNVEAITITACVAVDEELMELEPADIELAESDIQLLLAKVTD